MTELFAPSNSQSIGVFYRLILPMIFILIGVAVLWFGVAEFLSAKEAANWKSIEGVIDSSTIVSGIREVRENNRTRRYKEYAVAVAYHFSVDGKIIQGHRIRFGDAVYDAPDAAERDTALYPTGKSVTVYVNPDNPNECLLEREMGSGAFALPALGVLFLIVGLAVAFFLNR